MNAFHTLTVALLFSAAMPLAALAAGDHAGQAKEKTLVAQGTGDMSDAEVRKVDKDSKKLTLKHGEIKNLDMPGMTMVFAVKEPGMVDMVKAGDKVKFKAEKINGTFTVTAIQPAP
jgi:Cu(I)/Ag(I) efflux system periplasmic protein CusF